MIRRRSSLRSVRQTRDGPQMAQSDSGSELRFWEYGVIVVCRRLGRSAALLTTAVALVAASPGAGAVGVAVHVAPAVGGPGTTFVVSFVAPTRTGVNGSMRLRDELSIETTPAVGRCLDRATQFVPAAHGGQAMRVRLDPVVFGGRWCVGVFRGQLLELQTAVCPPGAFCPTYVRIRTIARFSLVVRRIAPGGDVTPPQFAGLERAFACTPGPQRPGETTPFSLSWQPASDNRTPAAGIVYDVYFASRAGGENFSRPTWTTQPGATRFRTPGLPSHASAFFVVRARDAAGNEYGNSREVSG
ncbi:MAG TPA: hypothetical protein VMU73_07560, partial [Gaiellaceae bacterium]|nr:hypothetical protein [Gaiellaceae bacterium]